LGTLAADPLPIGFFASLDSAHPFWVSMKEFETAVGKGLDLDSRWSFADSDQFLGADQIREAAQGPDPIRGAVITDFKGQGTKFLEEVQALRVPTITFVGFDTAEVGAPRQTNAFWIGNLAMHDDKVGERLASALINEALKRNLVDADNKIHIVAVSGDKNSNLAKAREAGLAEAVAAQNGRVVLEQTVWTKNWSEEEGQTLAAKVLARYPQTTVVWCANDALAVGFIKGTRDTSMLAGRNYLIGGVDWIPEALELIKKGTMLCSVGGLMFQAGWAAVLLKDYLSGDDFAPSLGTTVWLPEALIDGSNVGTYLPFLQQAHWDTIDFKRYSRAANPNWTRYDFSLAGLRAAVKEQGGE
jgi:ABC-type sugar transport system substrate-binding protein